MNRFDIEKSLAELEELKKGLKKSEDADEDDMNKSADNDEDDMKKGEEEDEDEEIEKALEDVDEDATDDEIKEKLYEKGYNKSFIDKAKKAFRKGKVKKGLPEGYKEVTDLTPLYKRIDDLEGTSEKLAKSFSTVLDICKSLKSENESLKKSLDAPNQKGRTYVAKAVDKFDKKDTETNQELGEKERYDTIVKGLRNEAYVNYNPDSQMNEPKNLEALDALRLFQRTGDETYAKPFATAIKKSFPNINLF